jgi:hypothetical protein
MGTAMTEAAQATADKPAEKEADHHPYYRPKDAATLILVDRSASVPKVLVGKRHDKVVFMPGKFVFPGGRGEPVEGQPEDRALAGPIARGCRDPRGLRGDRALPRP